MCRRRSQVRRPSAPAAEVAATRYVAFLRAINVPGHGNLRMTDLRAAFEAAGCTYVRSYIQSGNVLFEASDEETLARMRVAVGELAGSPASIILRTISDLTAIAAAHPFAPYLNDRSLKLYVVFLSAQPSRDYALPIVDLKERLELIAVEGSEAYLVSRRKPNGMYGFPTIFLERELGVAATARNWNTVRKLLAFAKQGSG